MSTPDDPLRRDDKAMVDGSPDLRDVEEIRVVAGVVRNRERAVLLQLRPANTPSAGIWEFPGGKVNDGESDVQALQRELHEELNIPFADDAYFTVLQPASRNGKYLVTVYARSESIGQVTPQINQAIEWVYVRDLASFRKGRRFTPSTNATMDELLRQLA